MKNDMKDLILGLIKKNSICSVSEECILPIKDLVAESKLQNENPVLIDREKAIETYSRRAKLLSKKGVIHSGVNELLDSLAKSNGQTAIVQMNSKDRSLTIFLDENLSKILGVMIQ